MNEASSLYPSEEGMRSMVNRPAESVVVPLTTVLSGAIRATVANSIGACVAASSGELYRCLRRCVQDPAGDAAAVLWTG